MPKAEWIDVGALAELSQRELQPVTAKRTRIALCYREGQFSAISGGLQPRRWAARRRDTRRRVRGVPVALLEVPLPDRRRRTGLRGRRVPSYPVKVEGGRVLVDIGSATPRSRKPHEPHPLARPIKRAPGPVRVVGISTTVMIPSTRATALRTRCSRRRSRMRRRAVAKQTPYSLRELNFRALRRLLLEKRARLHLAMLDHADGSRPTSSTASTKRSSTGPT